MSDKPKVYVAGIGMITPVGANAEMTAAFVRCGRSAHRETEYYDDDFNKVRMATVPDEALENCLDEALLKGDMTARQARMLQMAKLAMSDILPKLPKGEKVPLFLAGPEQTGANDKPLNTEFIDNLALQTGSNLDLESCRITSMGRAGGLNVIKLAFRFFESTDARFVLVGGVDSFYDKDTLDHFAAEKRLLCGDAMDGFIPGEGAAFLLLTNEMSSNNAAGLPCIYEPGVGTENGHLYSEKTYTGDGLSTAVTMAIGNAEAPKVRTIYSSMNGESFFAKEYGVALLRNSDAIDDKMKLEHPADCYGDLGAASGAVLLCLTAMNITKYKDRSPCLIYCSSDREYRSAVVMQT